jgi:hypothetical protein
MASAVRQNAPPACPGLLRGRDQLASRFWELYAPLLSTLHPDIWKEAKIMAKSKRKSRGPNWSLWLEEVGLQKYVEALKVGDYIDTVGPKKVLKEIGIDRILANLSAEDRQKLKEKLE